MPDAHSAEPTTIFFLGSDTTLFEGLHNLLHEHGIALRGFRTVAGMMLAADQWSAPVVIMELAALPPGREPMQLLDRLEDACGVRPLLVCLGCRQTKDVAKEGGPSASFTRPYDHASMAATLVELVGTRVAAERRVLVIGDSPVEQGAMARVLHHAGIRTRVTDSAGDITRIVDEYRPHLVLLDLDTSADKSGRELAICIRDCPGCEGLPIVFLSGDSPLSHRVDALRIGGDDYLTKPLSATSLLQTIQSRIGTGAESEGPRAGGLTVMDWNGFRRRLDRAVREDGEPNAGEAVLAIRLEQTPALGHDDSRRAAVESAIGRLGRANERAAWSQPDEIVLWLRRDSAASVAAAADAMRSALSDLFVPTGASGQGSVSIGIAPFKDRADNAQTMISRAQAAEGQAHGLGGDRVIQHVCALEAILPETPEETQSLDATLLPVLRRAIHDQGFQLVFQPILPLRRAGRHRYEVLLRLRTPTGAIIPPLTFLPVAARHGLLVDLDRWVLSRALNALRQERDAGRDTLLLIHQTADSLLSGDWLTWVRSEIIRHDLVRQRPVLELSAAAILAKEAPAAELFPALRRLGIEICLAGVGDDPALHDLLERDKVAFVKLDRSLMAPASGVPLRPVVKGFHKQRVRVIASGIEDPEAIGRAWSSGVDYIQGNFIQFPEESLNFNFDEMLLAKT